MDLGKTSSVRSAASSKTKIALEFLRVDKARFNNDRTPIPLPIAVIEQRRKRTVNKRYMACMMARKQASREKEAKELDNREAVLKDLGADSSLTLNDGVDTPVIPWPGFRYHNNGDVRTLSNVQKQRRLLASMRAGQGHRQSTVEVPFLSSAESNDAKARATTSFKSRSVDSLRLLIAKRSANRFSSDSLPTQGNTSAGVSGLVTPGAKAASSSRKISHHNGLSFPSIPEVTSGRKVNSATPFARKTPSLFAVSGVPSNRSIGSSRLNLNQFGPAVKPVVTSSVWCNADDELLRRASLIPKDSFNIRFGLSSKMLHERKSDLDEHRTMEEKRSLENAKKIKSYIEHVKKQTY